MEISHCKFGTSMRFSHEIDENGVFLTQLSSVFRIDGRCSRPSASGRPRPISSEALLELRSRAPSPTFVVGPSGRSVPPWKPKSGHTFRVSSCRRLFVSCAGYGDRHEWPSASCLIFQKFSVKRFLKRSLHILKFSLTFQEISYAQVCDRTRNSRSRCHQGG